MIKTVRLSLNAWANTAWVPRENYCFKRTTVDICSNRFDEFWFKLRSFKFCSWFEWSLIGADQYSAVCATPEAKMIWTLRRPKPHWAGLLATAAMCCAVSCQSGAGQLQQWQKKISCKWVTKVSKKKDPATACPATSSWPRTDSDLIAQLFQSFALCRTWSAQTLSQTRASQVFLGHVRAPGVAREDTYLASKSPNCRADRKQQHTHIYVLYSILYHVFNYTRQYNE